MEERFRELAASRAATLARQPFASLCYAPCAQLHFTPDGTIAVCSKSTHRVVGHVQRDRILDVWRGPALASLRAALRDGRFPPGCELCERQLARENVRGNPLLDFDHVVLPEDPAFPSRVEFAFSDLCNLACIHCSPELSSVWRTRAGLPARPNVYDDAFFAGLEPLLPHLRQVSFLGGEPFLQEPVHRLWAMLTRVARGVQVNVTTNGTVWNDRVREMLTALRTSVSVSLDGVTPATFERARQGARFERVMANLEPLRTAVKANRGQFRLNFCLMRATWHEFAAFLEFAERFGATPWVTLVTSPAAPSLLSLAPRHFRRVLDRLRANPPRIDPAGPGMVKWHAMLRTLAASEPGEHRYAMHHVHELRRAGKSRSAFVLLHHVPADAPEHGQALVMRAEHHLDRGELDAAGRLLEAAAACPSPPLDLHLREAWLHFRRGDAVRGLTSTDLLAQRLAAVAEPPRHLRTGLLAVRANLLRCAGRIAEAVAASAELARLEPENPQHAEFLAVLQREHAGA